jgi:predicted  nucleic acid-binding Zn-ribbon protein
LSKNSGSLSFATFGINVCLGGDDRVRQSDFAVHRMSTKASRIFSGGVARFDSRHYIPHEAPSNTSAVPYSDSTGTKADASELESLKDEIARAASDLKATTSAFEKLNARLAEGSKELSKLKEDGPAVDLVARSLMHFDEPLDSISWTVGVSRATLAKLVVDSIPNPTPHSILGVLLALTASFSDGGQAGELVEELRAFIKKNKLETKDFSNLMSDIAVSSFQASIHLAEIERDDHRARLAAEIEALNNELRTNKETQKSLESSITLFREKKFKLEESLSASIRDSLSSVGIFANKQSSTVQFLEEIAALTFTHPYAEDKFDVLEAVLQGKFSPNLVRALLSKFLNQFEDGQKTCCMKQADACRCDPAESSRKEVENRLNLTWSEWKTVLGDRGLYCWPLNLLDQLSLLKEMSNFYHHPYAMAHFLESMLTPSWATRVSVVRNRMNMPSSLSVQEEATLNAYLRENFGFSRSDVVQTLINEHPGLKGKSPADIMLMISFLVGHLGVEETGTLLSAMVRQEA